MFCDCHLRLSESSNKLSQCSIFSCSTMVRLLVCMLCFKNLRLNWLLLNLIIFGRRNSAHTDIRCDQLTRPAERSSKLSHRNIRKRESIISFCKCLILCVLGILNFIFPGGISHRRNQLSCLAFRDHPIKPAERNSKLSHCIICKCDSISSFLNILILCVFDSLSFTFLGGISHCRNPVSWPNLLRHPAISAERSNKLSHCKIRKRNSIFYYDLSNYFTSSCFCVIYWCHIPDVEGKASITTVVVHVVLAFGQPSVTVQFIVEVPTLNIPLALFPGSVPVVVAPLME
jgi:hypothetical protein